MITNLIRKMQDIKRKAVSMAKKFEIGPMTRVFAENNDGDCFILTNNQVATFSDLQVSDKGAVINVTQETISPELSIMVLAKHEFFGQVKTKVDLDKAKSYRQIG